jgi:hypothetical protein
VVRRQSAAEEIRALGGTEVISADVEEVELVFAPLGPA